MYKAFKKIKSGVSLIFALVFALTTLFGAVWTYGAEEKKSDIEIASEINEIKDKNNYYEVKLVIKDNRPEEVTMTEGAIPIEKNTLNKSSLIQNIGENFLFVEDSVLVNGEPMTFYLGIDPTADSLHIGHFFALTLFRWLQDFGHHGIILIGGATALVGDPTGKSDMRKMLSKEEVIHNKAEVKELVKRFVKTDGDNPAIIVDNVDWICDKNYIDFMRDIGVHFNVNTMLNADCYKKRLENGGLTFLEMGYMLMQAFDFVHLNKEFGCRLQIGGSDQWANILAGADLSRKIGFSEGVKIDPLFG